MTGRRLTGCGGPPQTGPIPEGVDVTKETVITGVLQTRDGDTIEGGYVRLLDARGDFTAEVVSAHGGDFRFYAAPGDWTVRALTRQGNAESQVSVVRGVNKVRLRVG